MFALALKVLCTFGFEKTSVRAAHYIMSRYQIDSNTYDAVQHFLLSFETKLPECSWCHYPVLSGSESRHEPCLENIKNEMIAARQQEAYEVYMASTCNASGCFQEKDGPDGLCSMHASREDDVVICQICHESFHSGTCSERFEWLGFMGGHPELQHVK